MPQVLYMPTADKIRSRILAGEWREGEVLPGEITLAREYHVSRDTLRRALDVLRDEGLLATAHGYGTWVRRRTPRRFIGPDRYSPLAHRAGSTLLRLSQEEVPVRGETRSDTRIVTAAEVPETQRSWIGLDGDERLVERDATFRADERGQQMWRSWLPLRIVAGTSLADPATDPWAGTTLSLYESIGWHYVEIMEHVWPRRAEPGEAVMLDIPLGEPVLIVDRVMYFAREVSAAPEQVVPLEVARVILPGDSMVLVNRFHPPRP